MTAARAVSATRFDVEATRRDFPALRQRVHGHDLVYLDSAASALKPQSVVDAMVGFYTRDSANVHRGVHLLSQRATLAYEGAREKARAFLNAREACEVAFVRGTTEAMNLVAQTYGKSRLRPGDEVLLTGLEHHSNIVPWQMVAEETGARLVIVPVTDSGDVEVDAVAERLTDRTKIVSIAHVSNALGTVLPLGR